MIHQFKTNETYDRLFLSTGVGMLHYIINRTHGGIKGFPCRVSGICHVLLPTDSLSYNTLSVQIPQHMTLAVAEALTPINQTKPPYCKQARTLRFKEGAFDWLRQNEAEGRRVGDIRCNV